MPTFPLADWSAHLRHVAATAARPGPLEAGDLEPPIRATVVEPERAGFPDVPGLDGAPPGPSDRADGAVRLWWARAGAAVDVDATLEAGSGPIFAVERSRTIEVWTDCELAAMHALWWLARDRGRADWAARLETARRWHLEHTQPDNATNRPWAVHVYLLARDPESTLYAETLLHNALASEGRPTPLAAWLLVDAARAIDLEG